MLPACHIPPPPPPAPYAASFQPVQPSGVMPVPLVVPYATCHLRSYLRAHCLPLLPAILLRFCRFPPLPRTYCLPLPTRTPFCIWDRRTVSVDVGRGDALTVCFAGLPRGHGVALPPAITFTCATRCARAGDCHGTPRAFADVGGWRVVNRRFDALLPPAARTAFHARWRAVPFVATTHCDARACCRVVASRARDMCPTCALPTVIFGSCLRRMPALLTGFC